MFKVITQTALFFLRTARTLIRGQRGRIRRQQDIRAVVDRVPVGAVAVDVGAHGGEWTFALARQVGPTGHVYAFEPSPEYAPVLIWTCHLLGLRNVTIVPFAVSSRCRIAAFRTVDQTGRRLTGESQLALSSEAGDTSVLAVGLDDLLPLFPRLAETRFVKIDVEGAEMEVLQGASKVIGSSAEIVICEIESRHYARRGGDPNEVFAKFRSFGLLPDLSNHGNNTLFVRTHSS